jgi:hypothetical protein
MFYATENLTPGNLTPFTNLVEHQRFASYLAWSAGNAPDISISPDARKVTYKDKTLDVAKWQNGLRKLHTHIKKLMEELLHGHNIPVTVPCDTPDNMAESTWGYSWIHNGQFTEPHALLRRLMQDKDMDLCTVTQRGELIWNVAAMTEWMMVARCLNILLCIETHCVPGQVSRASELCDGRIINGLRGRNLFRIHGSTWWVNRRVKSEHLVHHESFIPVKFPPEMEEVLHTYLLVIRPVEIEFARRLWGQETAALYHEYMWVTMDHRLMEEQFSRELEYFTEHYCDCGLSVRPYRQIVVALSRAYLGSEGEIEEDDSDALAEQRGHSIEMSRTHYGRRVDRLQCLTDDVLARFGHVSEAWWKLVGFFPGGSPLLPLDQRRRLRMSNQNMGQNEPHAEDPVTKAVPALNKEELMGMMKLMITNALTEFGGEMKNEIRTAVASGMAAFLDRQQSVNPAVVTSYPAPAQHCHAPVPPAPAPAPAPAPSPAPAPAPAPSPAPAPAPAPAPPPVPVPCFHISVPPAPIHTQASAPAKPPTPAPGPAEPLASALASPILNPGQLTPPFGSPDLDPGLHPFYGQHEENDIRMDEDDDQLSYIDEPVPEPSPPPTLVRQKDSLALLRELLSNDKATFKSPGQKTIVDMALEGEKNLIAVLRTGGGKSMSYLVPAYADQLSGHGMTIAVIPNKVLLANVMQQTARYGVKSSVWVASKPTTTDTHLVLMAIETVTSPKFQE